MGRTIQLFIFLMACSITSISQSITAEEYNSTVGKARDRLNLVSHRVTKTEKFYKSKKLVGTSVTINEKLIPDKARMLLAIETDGVLVPKFERIYIANVQFVKQERGEWKKFDSSEKESGGGFRAESPVFVRKVETKDISQYMVIDSSVENKPAKLYYYLRCSLIGTVMYIFEQRTWIDENGKIIKETESQRNTTPDNITQLGTTNYEYDPKNLKIEAPIK